MNSTNQRRYRGIFGLSLDRLAPGFLTISSDHEIEVEIFASAADTGEGEGPCTLFGELHGSDLGGACVVARRALRIRTQHGTGGSLQVWRARELIASSEFFEEDDTFDRISVSFPVLSSFIQPPPFDRQSLTRPTLPTEHKVAHFETQAAKVDVKWGLEGNFGPAKVDAKLRPLFSLEANIPISLDELSASALNPLRSMLTIASRQFAGTDYLVAWRDSDPRNRFSITAAHLIDPSPRSRPANVTDLMFRLGDLADATASFSRVEELFETAPDFTAVFFSHERTPPRFVEEKYVSSFASIAHLMGLLPSLGLCDVPASPTGSSDAPPPSFACVPETAATIFRDHLDNGALLRDTASLEQEFRAAWRWATFREGERIDGRRLFDLHSSLRAVTHFAMLVWIGFDASQAKKRLMDTVGLRGWY